MHRRSGRPGDEEHSPVDGGVSAGAHADPSDVAPDQLFHSEHVVLGVFRQVFELGALGDVLRPGWHALVLDLHLGEHLQIAGHVLDSRALVLVRYADLDLVQAGQHVQLGEVERREPIDLRREAHLRHIQPAAPSGPSRRGSKLPSHTTEPLSDVVLLLGREGAVSHTRAVGLHGSPDAADRARRDAEAGAHRTDAWVGARDVGIGACIDAKPSRVQAGIREKQ
eukprot:scaffold3144_cov260-Pinguiococcus_pyrenoidosus.AAC.4